MGVMLISSFILIILVILGLLIILMIGTFIRF